MTLKHLKKLIIISLLITTIANAETKIKTVVSILPLKYLVQRVGGNKVEVNTLIGQGQNPELYEPQPKQIAMLTKAVIYYQIGLPFEQKWIKKIKSLNPNITITDVRKGIKFIYTDGAPDPHIWTSPAIAKIIAKNILDSLLAIDFDNRKIYTNNYAALIKDLAQLDQEIKAKLLDIHPRTFLVLHPAWGYFAAAYGLKQLAVEIEGKESGPKDLVKVISTAQQEKLKVVFIQPQFGSAKAQALADILHAKIGVLDPLKENYIYNLLDVAEKIAKST